MLEDNGRKNMNDKHDILVLVKTYPELSKRHTETVCTAGIDKDTKTFIRLYPIRYRYLTGEAQFKKYQWIKVKIVRANSDSRHESYNIADDIIELGDIIGTGDGWVEREKWITNDNTLFNSVEELFKSQKKIGTSLGIVKAKEIISVTIKPKSLKEIRESEIKKKGILSQKKLFEELKDIELLPFRLVLKFKCYSPDCKTHHMSILDWEYGELYRKVKNSNDWEQKIIERVKKVCGPKNDVHLILGNLAKWPNIFCILGIFYPPKRRQRPLL